MRSLVIKETVLKVVLGGIHIPPNIGTSPVIKETVLKIANENISTND
jgi:hypothetical protein